MNMEKFEIKAGFTLIEIMVVVVILGLAMYMAVPMFSGAAGMQMQSGANMIAADLEYAKSMAISCQQQYGIIFKTDTEYDVVDQAGNPVPHPVKNPMQAASGPKYIVDFHKADIGLNKIDKAAANFDGTNKVTFDYLGSPYNGSGGALNAQGTITVQSGASTMRIYVEPVTGFIHQ